MRLRITPTLPAWHRLQDSHPFPLRRHACVEGVLQGRCILALCLRLSMQAILLQLLWVKSIAYRLSSHYRTYLARPASSAGWPPVPALPPGMHQMRPAGPLCPVLVPVPVSAGAGGAGAAPTASCLQEGGAGGGSAKQQQQPTCKRHCVSATQ